jgi:WhiB family transcriptional regulator, redox-sensing transcriptional regulator
MKVGMDPRRLYPSPLPWRPVNEAEVLWLMSGDDHVLPTLEDFLTRPPWMADPACRGMGTAAWFPDRGEHVGPAKTVCARCSVRAECLDYSMADPELAGIWGGTAGRERGRLRRTAG